MKRIGTREMSAGDSGWRKGRAVELREFRVRSLLLLAVTAAFVFVPASQAFASETLELKIEGTGSGEVVPFSPTAYTGTPAIDCHYVSPGPQSGACATQMSNEGDGYEGVFMKPVAAVGSEFVEWIIEEGEFEQCNLPAFHGACLVYAEPPGSGSGTAKVKAVFAAAAPQHETLELQIEGTGSGLVVPFSATAYTGSPALDCHYISPGPQTGTCTLEMSDEGDGYEGVFMKPVAAAGSEFVEWVIESGEFEQCNLPAFHGACLVYAEPPGSGSGTAKVKAVFNLSPPVALEIEVKGEGKVSATAPPNPTSGHIAACAEASGECAAEYAESSKVPLVATADPGSHFVGWSTVEGNAGSCTAATTSCETGELNGPAKLKAVFAHNTHTLTVNTAGTGGGTVTCNGVACASSYAEGTTVTLAATSSSGSIFVGWSGGGCSGTGNCVLTLNSNATVTATFNKTEKPADTCATNAALCPPPAAGTATAVAKAQVKGNKASLELACAGGPCKGSFKLTAKIKQGKKVSSQVIGQGSFNIVAGKSATVSVTIVNGSIKKMLKKGKTVKVKLTGSGIKSGTVKLKLSPSRAGA